MKKLIAIASISVLAACQSEPAEDTVVEETVVEAPEAVTVANGSAPGTYEATAPDGTVTTTVINEDGTYTDSDAEGNVVAEGTWAVVDEKTCFTPTTDGVEAMCFTESAPAEDGSFTATPDEGDPVTVRPAAATEEAAAE